MIYLIGFLILAAAVLVANQMGVFKTKNIFVCNCDKCDDKNCKCEENKCSDNNCKCHDVVSEAPSPYMNGHSVKVTAVAEPEVTEAPTEAPTPEVTPEAPKEEPKKEVKKPTIKKVSPPKKADPKKKKK